MRFCPVCQGCWKWSWSRSKPNLTTLSNVFFCHAGPGTPKMIHTTRRLPVIFVGLFVISIWLIHGFWIPTASSDLNGAVPVSNKLEVLVPEPASMHVKVDVTAISSALDVILQELESRSNNVAHIEAIAPHNRKVLHGLLDCISFGTCSRNQSKCTYIRCSL